MIAPPPNENAKPAASGSDSSDSDWDEDDDFTKKINIKIKPIAHMTPGKISASVDELRASVGTWKSMANINLVKPNSRRSHYQSTVQLAPPEAANLLQKHHMEMIQPQLVRSALLKSPPSEPLMQHQQYEYQPYETPIGLTAYQNQIPVALAVQECLNVLIILGPSGGSTTNLLGHIKMAVPKNIIQMNLSRFENQMLDLHVDFSKVWDNYQLNRLFVTETLMDTNHNLNSYQINNDHQSELYLDQEETPQTSSFSSDKFTKNFSVDMAEVYTYSRDLDRKQQLSSNYFLLPELISYNIHVHERNKPTQTHQSVGVVSTSNDHQPSNSYSNLNPLQPVAHWLCDLTVTKVRVDLNSLETDLSVNNLSPSDIRNVKISLQVNGGVVSQQSKPAASWSSVESRLTWSFATLQELVDASTVNGVTSCLAKFNLNDGPSTPNAMEMQFSIMGKTLSGTRIGLQPGMENQSSYRISKQKYEVRTGKFKCET